MDNLPNIRDAIYFDIETAPVVENYSDLSDELKLAWRIKNTNDGVVCNNPYIPAKALKDKVKIAEKKRLFEEALLEDEFKTRAALYTEFNRIVCVTVGLISGVKFVTHSKYGTDEKKILQAVSALLLAYPGRTLIGHAAKYFDAPQLVKKYWKYGLVVPNQISFFGKKPWECSVGCTNELYKVGTSPGGSLKSLCLLLGVQSPKDMMDGAKVGEAYYAGKLEDIVIYCEKDVIATAGCYVRMYSSSKVRDQKVLDDIYSKQVTDFFPHEYFRTEVDNIQDFVAQVN